MTLAISTSVIPTGGIIAVTCTTAVSGNIILERSPYPSISYTTLYSGTPFNSRGEDYPFLDLGDQSAGILLPTSEYVYRLTDATGTITSTPVTPVASLNIDYINWTPIFIAMLQGAVTIVQLPNGFKRPRVIHAMPLTGLLPMPFIVVTPELDQQEEIPIGQSNIVRGEGFVEPPYVNIWTQTAFDRNVYRVSVLSTSAVERDFYHKLVIAAFRANLPYIFQQYGADISHSYQAATYQAVDVHAGNTPGFYGVDIMLEFTGTSNVTVYTNYGVISEIDMFTTIQQFSDQVDQVTDEVIVPNLGGR